MNEEKSTTMFSKETGLYHPTSRRMTLKPETNSGVSMGITIDRYHVEVTDPGIVDTATPGNLTPPRLALSGAREGMRLIPLSTFGFSTL